MMCCGWDFRARERRLFELLHAVSLFRLGPRLRTVTGDFPHSSRGIADLQTPTPLGFGLKHEAQL